MLQEGSFTLLEAALVMLILLASLVFIIYDCNMLIVQATGQPDLFGPATSTLVLLKLIFCKLICLLKQSTSHRILCQGQTLKQGGLSYNNGRPHFGMLMT